MRRPLLLLAASIALCQAVPVARGGGTLYFVNSTGDAPLVGSSNFCDSDPGTPGEQCTLRAAIQASNLHIGDDGIEFAIPASDPNFDPATGRATIKLGSALPALAEGVSIAGPGASSLTVRRETSVEFRIFPVTTGGSVSLSGMTITNGSAGNPTHGGGAENTNAGTLSIIGCVVSDSFGSECGGIHNNSTGTLNVTNSTVSGNGSDVNGGILNRSTGTVNVLNSAITVNRSFRFGGAGIYNRGTGTVNITDSFIANNESGNRGSGGIKNDGSGTVNVTRSTISNNFDSFDKGGGIYIGNGTVNITASTVSRNTAKGGGGIFNLAGSLIITNSTVSQNASTTDNGGGGGLRNEGSVPSATAHFSVIQ